MYALSVAASASRTCSTRLNCEPITSHETPIACHGDADQARDASQVEGRSDARELRGRGAEVRDDEDRGQRDRGAHAQALADQPGEALSVTAPRRTAMVW